MWHCAPTQKVGLWVTPGMASEVESKGGTFMEIASSLLDPALSTLQAAPETHLCAHTGRTPLFSGCHGLS